MDGGDSKDDSEDRQPEEAVELESAAGSPDAAPSSPELASADGVAAKPAAQPTTNGRPERVEALLFEGATFNGWFLANRRQARFFVLNLEKVLEDLNPNHTRTEPVFRAVERLIAQETKWPTQYRFDYVSSHTQIFPEKRSNPKLFGHAATIIVAMELIAAEIDRNYNVYDYLRILPATFFIDRFHRQQLADLEAHFEKMTSEQREKAFGPDAAHTFEQLVLNSIQQANSSRLLQQMVAGQTVTRWICEKTCEFVNLHFPKHLHLGPTRSSGDPETARPEPGAGPLGTKGTASALRVPKLRAPEELPPCR